MLLRTAPVHFDGKESDPYLDDGGAHYPPINAGEDFDFSIEVSDEETDTAYDLTGCTAQWIGRFHKRGESEAFDVLAEIDAAAGLITLELSSTETAALGGLEGVHQLELTLADGKVRRLIEGRWTSREQVTEA